MLPQDIARIVTVGEPAVAPGGTTVACTLERLDLEANRSRRSVWLVPVAGGEPRQLTAGTAVDSSPRFSPDGTRLAFARVERRDDGKGVDASVIVLPVDGPGDAVTVATAREEIRALDWSPDGTRLAWTTRVRPDDADVDDRARQPRRIDTLMTRLDSVGWIVDRRSHVFVGRVDGTEAPRQVTDGPYDHGPPRWSPDGTRLVFAAGRHDGWDLDEVEQLWVADVDGGGLEAIDTAVRHWRLPAWSPDGERIAALYLDDPTGRHTKVGVVDVATGAVATLGAGHDRTFAPFPGERSPVWVDDTAVLASVEDGGRASVVRLGVDGSAPAGVATGDRWVLSFDAAGGTLAIVSSTVDELPELSCVALGDGDGGGDGGGERRLTTFGAAFHRACPSLPVERFTVPSPAGDTDLDAWMVAPEGFDGGGRWPVLVSIHGGPMTQYGDRWFDEFQLWASAGFAVVACNPHGSSGREEAFARAIRSPLAEVDPGTGWGGIDADDVLAVFDAALARWPALDGARAGVLGGSYGGYLTSWLMARTDRFAAGCSERAVNNVLSEEWSADIGGYFNTILGVSHLDHPEEYLRLSPATYVRDITAPILILHSENDLRCPTEQADALFVPLRLLGRDVEYWRFPAESHEMSRSGSPVHRIRRAELIIDFFRRHLDAGA